MRVTLAVLSTAAALAAGLAIFARRRPAYDALRHTISELGERGARDGRLVSLGLFLPVGLAMAAIAGLQRASLPDVAGLAFAIAVGYLGAAFFPCDPGSPMHGSTRQGLHNLAGGVEYVGGTIALWRLGSQHPSCFVLAGIVAGATLLLSSPHRWRGLVQRIGEVALFGGLALAASS